MPTTPTPRSLQVAHSPKPPTSKQLSYLRRLALRTGTTFAVPQTSRQASTEIQRLKAIKRTGFTFAELDAERAAREANADVCLTSSAYRDDEITGWGVNATWKDRS
jgi:hypothetical protein